MANFYVSLSAVNIASQIAALINSNNRLYKRHSDYSVLNAAGSYFIEVYGDRVVGCAQMIKEQHDLSKILHVSVDPAFRRRGIAKKLITTALDNCETMLIYMTIREDNQPSLRMAETMNFVFSGKYWSRDHNVYIMGRKLK